MIVIVFLECSDRSLLGLYLFLVSGLGLAFEGRHDPILMMALGSYTNESDHDIMGTFHKCELSTWSAYTKVESFYSQRG